MKKVKITPEGLMILEELEPLFIEARSNELWFYCGYQCLWFSPAELRVEHKRGKFIWGAENWKLRNPIIKLNSLRSEIEKAKQAYTEFKYRLTIPLK